MKGFRAATAISITFQIFFACISPRLPPALVKSWAAAKTVRPLIRPNPVTTPSPGISFSPKPKSVERCFTKSWTSWNVPVSKSVSSRSRAVSLPELCCFWTSFSPPIAIRAAFFSSNCRIFSSVGSFVSIGSPLSPKTLWLDGVRPLGYRPYSRNADFFSTHFITTRPR